QLEKLRSQIKDVQARADGELAAALAELDKAAAALAGVARVGGFGGFGGPRARRDRTLSGASQEMSQLLHVLQGADATPTATAVAACEEVVKLHRDLQARWAELLDKDVKAVNERLSKAGLPALAAKGN